MHRRLVLRSAFAGAVLLSLTACGGGGGEAAPAASGAASSAPSSAAAGGTISIITVDPSNPYWKAEVDTAVAEAKKLGYQTTTAAHNNKPDEQNSLIETAINDKVKGVVLDPAGADESVAAVQKLVDANIPVVLVNAEISKTGLAKAQIVSNNAQGATLGAEEWSKAMDYKGTYVELLGKPSDNNAQVRSDGYKGVISQYPDLKKVGEEIANWDRQEGQEKMESLLSKNPDIDGVIAGNDEMALGRDQRPQGGEEARPGQGARLRRQPGRRRRGEEGRHGGHRAAAHRRGHHQGGGPAQRRADRRRHRRDRGEAGDRLRADHQGQRRPARQLRPEPVGVGSVMITADAPGPGPGETPGPARPSLLAGPRRLEEEA